MKKKTETQKEQKEVFEVQFDAKEVDAVSAMTDALVKAYGFQEGGQIMELAVWLRQKVAGGEKKKIDV